MNWLSLLDVSRPRGRALIALACLLLSLGFFAPRLWLMRHYVPGSFQWDRGHTYLLQCGQPFRHDVETAMRWRRLPPIVAHGLGLTGNLPFILPWLGIIALLGYVAVLHARRLPETEFVFGGTLVVATTSAVLVPTGWLGINDAWVWLGLLAVAFGRARWAVPLACLLCPWIDERFLIGLPLAWVTGCVDRQDQLFSRRLLRSGWILPYVVLRLALGGNPATERNAVSFLAAQWQSMRVFIPMAPLGWWMGLRVGWLGIGYALVATRSPMRWVISAGLGATLAVALFLASDISRSTAIALPLVLLGAFLLARHEPKHASGIMLVTGCVSLLIPAAHVVLTHIDPISPLPIELFRWWRTW